MEQMNVKSPQITIDAFNRLLAESAPFQRIYGFVTEDIGHGTARVRLPAGEAHIRPGGTLSGPAQMALADFTMYAALLGAIGEVPLAVTTSLNMNFLQRPQPGDLRASCRLLKLGKRLAVGDIMVYSEGLEAPVSHATATYSIPPRE
ncbi:PaaI family thioesterase [Pelagibius marinus]|uniref:PaaI family thioesterase n=1 Tax=Pelagibius marinus TaxID=2762760 RepID=UPI001D055480|nr:PaaI family thioesterase [Pelagibius marinus]